MAQTVLIVSEDPARLKIMAGFLEQAGYLIYTAAERESRVVELADQIRPALVILDWRLANGAELEIVKRLRADRNTCNVLILLMGTMMGEQDCLAGFDAGADMCVTDALHERVFVARVKSLLKKVN